MEEREEIAGLGHVGELDHVWLSASLAHLTAQHCVTAHTSREDALSAESSDDSDAGYGL